MIKAIFSDFDGVIVDSEVLMVESNEKFMKKMELPYDEQELKNLIGSSPQMDLWRKVYEHANAPYSYEVFREHLWEHRAHVRKLNYKEIMFPDVPKAFQRLKDHGMYVAVASSSRKESLEQNLKNCNLYPYLDWIISGEMFKESKPNPEIYLACAAHFSLQPEQCVVIEDSYYGIKSGKRAGMFVIAIKDYNFGIDQSEADMIVDTMSEACDAIIKINENERIGKA